MTRSGRFALLSLVVLGSTACSSMSDRLKSRDGGVDAGGSSGASGSSAGGASGTDAGVDGSAPGDSGGEAGAGTVQCSDPTFADCTSAPGCETMLGTANNCAGCGDLSCTIANTFLSCSSDNGCTSAVCATGYANCDRSSPDCETVIATGASCLPTYRGSIAYVTGSYISAAAAVATDGSYFLAGTLGGTVTFGTPAAPDVVVTPSNITSGFITRFNADGSYAWTRTFPSSPPVFSIAGDTLAINGLAAAPDGGVVAVGHYSNVIDLDPGPGVESHQTMRADQHEAFVLKLAADGSFAWGGTFTDLAFDGAGSAGGVAIDGAGAVYVAGWYGGEVDLDPGAGIDMHASRSHGSPAVAGALVKLTPAGKLSWARSEDDGYSVPPGGPITLATDGAIWMLGDPDEGLASFAAFEPDGSQRGSWTIGRDASSLFALHSIAAGLDGSVYIGGAAWGIADLDPGPGLAERLLGTSVSGGFIVKVGSDGRYLWDQTLAGGGDVFAVAGARDGGVVGLGIAGLMKLDADGTPAWTFRSASSQGMLVPTLTGFMVAGSTANNNFDEDPGPGVDIIGGYSIYLARFDL